ncbi:MAG: MGMT family protein [Pontiellaceae bacterium]|nr:MGMT family protein [Pontiellaceae bacterium]
MNIRLQIHSVTTSWGPVVIEVKGQRVERCSLSFLKDAPKTPFKIETVDDAPSAHYIAELLSGRNASLPSIWLPESRPFQCRVWKGIQSIPWGKTLSYAALAERIGSPRAVRATANACGKNPLPLFIPCHRIVRSNGTLGGFSSGIAWKKLLLELEGISF